MPDATPPPAPAAAPAAATTPAAPAARPEAPAGGAAAPGQAAAPATPPAAPADADPIAPKLGRVAKRESQVRELQMKFEQERKTFEEQRKALEADAAEAKRLRALKENPLALVRELGMTPQQFLEMASKNDAADPAVVAAIQEERAKREELEKRLTSREEQERRIQAQQQQAAYEGRIEALAQKGEERWQLTTTSRSFHPQQVLSRAVQYVKEQGITSLTPDQENKLFEAILDDMEVSAEAEEDKRIETAKWKKKYGAKFAPAPPATPAAKPDNTPRTLTNSDVSSTPPPGGKRAWSQREWLEIAKAKAKERLERK